MGRQGWAGGGGAAACSGQPMQGTALTAPTVCHAAACPVWACRSATGGRRQPHLAEACNNRIRRQSVPPSARGAAAHQASTPRSAAVRHCRSQTAAEIAGKWPGQWESELGAVGPPTWCFGSFFLANQLADRRSESRFSRLQGARGLREKCGGVGLALWSIWNVVCTLGRLWRARNNGQRAGRAAI